MATGECCDRKGMGSFLDAFLGMMSRSMKGLNSLVGQHAEEMGLNSLGVFDECPEGAPVLRFPQDPQDRLRIKWGEVDAQLAKIGKPTGLFTVPSEMLMGIRGENGDIGIRLIDVQMHRLDGVLQYLKENP